MAEQYDLLLTGGTVLDPAQTCISAVTWPSTTVTSQRWHQIYLLRQREKSST